VEEEAKEKIIEETGNIKIKKVILLNNEEEDKGGLMDTV